MCSCVSPSLNTSLVIWDVIPVPEVSIDEYTEDIFTLTSRTYTIDMYPMRRAIQRDSLRHIDNATFGSAVAGEVACANHPEDTRNIDNPAAVSIRVRILAEHLP